MIRRLTTRNTYYSLAAVLAIGVSACGAESLGPGEEGDQEWGASDIGTVVQGAEEGPYLERVVTEVAYPAGSNMLATVTCPLGGKVLSGGVRANNSWLKVWASWRNAGNRWAVGVRNPGAASSVKVYATCLMNSSGVSVFTRNSATGAMSPGDQETVTASCPSTSQLVGGGFEVTHEEGVSPWASYPMSNNRWRAIGQNDSSSVATVTALAMCLSGLSVDTTIASNSVVVEDGTHNAVSAQCPSGYWASGGGHVAAELSVFRSYGTTTSGRWGVRARNFEDYDLTLVSSALCLQIN